MEWTERDKIEYGNFKNIRLFSDGNNDLKIVAERLAFKNRLKQWGLDLIGERMAAAKEAMEQAQEAANSEEKSSAGDKYETGRAMGHLQKDMHARQLAESVKELATLHAVQ